MARYHIQAWGSDKYPDMDVFLNEYPEGILGKYPMVSIALLTAISKDKATQVLSKHGSSLS